MKIEKLYLIPTPLGKGDFNRFFPALNAKIISQIDYFIVEELRSARRFLLYAGVQKPIDELHFFILNEHTRKADMDELLTPCLQGHPVGLLSEAGVPCVADPGSLVVANAHRKNIPVVPLVGPSSILLSLMASGLNGQSFTFHGYLPIEQSWREHKLKVIEMSVLKNGYTHIFIETPYRNGKLMESICKICRPGTKVCVAMGLTTENAFIKTQTVEQWRKFFEGKTGILDKTPCIFLIGK